MDTMQVTVDTALSRNCDDPAECRQCDFDKEDHNIGQSEPEDVDEVPMAQHVATTVILVTLSGVKLQTGCTRMEM